MTSPKPAAAVHDTPSQILLFELQVSICFSPHFNKDEKAKGENFIRYKIVGCCGCFVVVVAGCRAAGLLASSSPPSLPSTLKKTG